MNFCPNEDSQHHVVSSDSQMMSEFKQTKLDFDWSQAENFEIGIPPQLHGIGFPNPSTEQLLPSDLSHLNMIHKYAVELEMLDVKKEREKLKRDRVANTNKVEMAKIEVEKAEMATLRKAAERKCK